MSSVATLCMLLMAGIVLWRIVGVAAVINVREFEGHWMRFAVMVAHWSLLGSGALAVAIGDPVGGPMLLLAAVFCIADRRRPS